MLHKSTLMIGSTKEEMKCKFLWVLLVMGIRSCAAQDSPQLLYFKLALIWPNSFCWASDVACRHSVPQNFTIKALWEEEFAPEYPTELTYCDTSADLTDDVIFRHRRDLLRFWPNLLTYNYSQNKEMWKELWKKFGSCCSDLPDAYLVRTIMKFREASNLCQVLKRSGIVPHGRSYPVNKILRAIRKGTGRMADIVCETDREGNVYLSEIHQCIEYEGDVFTDCQNEAYNCDNDPIFPDPHSA